MGGRVGKNRAAQYATTPPDGLTHDVPGDAEVVLTALATATVPLSCDALADALAWTHPPRPRWPPGRAARPTALLHPQAPPRPADQAATPRRQRRRSPPQHHHENEAAILLFAIAHQRSKPTDWGAMRDDELYQQAEAALKEAGLISSGTGPHRIAVTRDVLYSLRYDNDLHIAAERRENLPRDPFWEAWPRHTIETNPDGTVTDTTPLMWNDN